MNKLTKEEKAEVAARKRHKPMNDAIRGARGVTVDVPMGIPESHTAMGEYFRLSTGRVNGKGNAVKAKRELMKLKRQAVELGYVINDDGSIKHDFRTDEERAEQEGE